MLRARPFAARLFLALTASFCVANSVQNVRDVEYVKEENISRAALRHVPEIEDSFRRHGITRGFSLFWDSGVETVLTDGRIEVFPVTGELRPFRYLAPYAVFSHGRSGDRTAFVRVDQPLPPQLAELPQFNLARPEILELAYDRETVPDPEASMEIYYFDFNPFTYPPGHDPRDELARGR